MDTKKSPARTPLIGHATFSLAACVAGMLELSSRRPPLVSLLLTSLQAGLA